MFTHLRKSAFTSTRRFYTTSNNISVTPAKPIRLFAADTDQPLTTSDVFAKGKRVVVFGIPGAYTPVCSNKHVPSYLEKADELHKKGVDTIACLSVNDAYVMKAWGEKLNALGKIRFLGDPMAEFTKQIGLDVDLSAAGLGLRSKRFSMIVDNGQVVSVNVENSPADFLVTGADRILEQLNKLPKKQ